MSSCEVIQLPARGSLDVYAHQAPEVLRALLHTIVFHRALGLVRPQEVDSQLFDLTWVRGWSHGNNRHGRPFHQRPTASWS